MAAAKCKAAAAELAKEKIDEALSTSTDCVDAAVSAKDYATAAKAASIMIECKLAKGLAKQALLLAEENVEVFKSAGNSVGQGLMLVELSAVQCLMPGKESKEKALQSATEAKSLLTGDKTGEAAALCALAKIKCKVPAPKNDQPAARGQEALTMAQSAKDMCVAVGDKVGEAAGLQAVALAYSTMGSYEDCLSAADEALDLCLEMKDKSKEAKALLAMSGYHLTKKAYRKAVSDAEDALEIYQSLGSPRELEAVTAAFNALMEMGDAGGANKIAKDSLYRFQDSGNKAGEAETLNMLTNAYVSTGQPELALKTAKDALPLFEELGNKVFEAKLFQLVANLEYQMGRNDKAIDIGEDALSLQKEVGEDYEKAESALTLAEANMAKGDESAALQVINDMRTYFQQSGVPKEEAGMLLASARIALKSGTLDTAISNATRAQVILGEEGDSAGEADALQVVADAHKQKEEYKPSLRAAERARTLYRELGDKAGEALCLFIIAQDSVFLAVAEGARVGEQARFSRGAKDNLDKAQKTADQGIKIGRDLMLSPPYAEGLLGALLCVLGQVAMLNSKPEDALMFCDEAVCLFREASEPINEASALLLCADALRSTRQFSESQEAASEALRLSKEAGDAKGEEMANEVLGWLQEMQQRQQQAWMAQQAMMNPQMGALNMTPLPPQDGGGDMPAQAQSMARTERERGPALDLSKGVDAAVVRSKITEIACRITGAEDGEIEVDTPLMEAGLTSNSAILLRDELTQELPGINLPVTLVFDYPSIGAMTDLVTSSGK